MTIIKHLSLDFADYWFGSSTIPVSVMLLTDTTTTIGEGLARSDDFWPLEVATGGGYTAGGWGGITMPALDRVDNTTDGVTEFNVGASTWTSTSSYTVSGFRWIVVMFQAYTTSGVHHGVPMVAWDLGASSSLTAEPLVLTVAPSPETTSSWPILRFKRFLA